MSALDYRFLGLFLLLFFALIQTGYAINVVGDTEDAGFSMQVKAEDRDTIEANAVLGESSISNL